MKLSRMFLLMFFPEGSVPNLLVSARGAGSGLPSNDTLAEAGSAVSAMLVHLLSLTNVFSGWLGRLVLVLQAHILQSAKARKPVNAFQQILVLRIPLANVPALAKLAKLSTRTIFAVTSLCFEDSEVDEDPPKTFLGWRSSASHESLLTADGVSAQTDPCSDEPP